MSDSHPIKQAFERYGLVLSKEDIAALEERCFKGYSRQKRLNYSRELHQLKIKDTIISVVYLPPGNLDPRHNHPQPTPFGKIVTVLPPEASTNKVHEFYKCKRR